MSQPQTHSLLKKHLRILGLRDHDEFVAGALSEERQRIATYAVPALDLERAAPRAPVRPVVWRSAVALAAAVALALVTRTLLTPAMAPDLTQKGGNAVFVYQEAGGSVRLFDTRYPAAEGSRFRVQVLASRQSVAWLIVTNAAGSLLTDPGQALASPLRLAAGEKGFFNDTIALVGANEGEILNVVICAAASLPKEGLGREGLMRFFQVPPIDVPGCVKQVVRLR